MKNTGKWTQKTSKTSPKKNESKSTKSDGKRNFGSEPDRLPLRAKKKGVPASAQVGGDYIEISVRISTNIEFQGVSTEAKWMTSDPKYLPVHGDARENVIDVLSEGCEIVSEAVGRRLDDMFECSDKLVQEKRFREG